MSAAAKIVLRPRPTQLIIFGVLTIFLISAFVISSMSGEYVPSLFVTATLCGFVTLFRTTDLIEIDDKGFSQTWQLGRTQIAWADTEEFSVRPVRFGPITLGHFVGFNQPSRVNRFWGRFNFKTSGVTSFIPDNFGMTPADLAALMNERRRAALNAQAMQN